MERPSGPEDKPNAPDDHPGTAGEVFGAFLKLGLTSFGGPIAHLGYFRQELVVRRRWIEEAAYADLVALCQFLPGPASSQVGFALGLRRAGVWGGLAAWSAFTLPSALLLLAFAYGAPFLGGPTGESILRGLKLVAVAIVAHAVWGMARTLTPDLARIAIALAAAALVLAMGGALAQIGAIVVGGGLGLLVSRRGPALSPPTGTRPLLRRYGWICLGAFLGLLLFLPMLARLTDWQALKLFDAFYRSGALVFGGGHVVLPLLQAEVVQPGWTTDDVFLAGYGAAQAVPGPLFTFSSYLGAVVGPQPNGVAGAAIALVAIFLPGVLILCAALPFWDQLRARPGTQAALRGANASVVGILAAALYDPVWTSAVMRPSHAVIAVTGFLVLTFWRVPAWTVVIGVVGLTALFASMT